jgi:SNF2 family DNA or RNA helicase
MANYQPQWTAYTHQTKALAAWGTKKFFALLMAMRTGKTKVTIDRWGPLATNNECLDLMVIAPAGVYRTWEKALREHADPKLLAKVLVYTWSAKHQKSKVSQRRYDHFLAQRAPRVLLINIEALSTVKAARLAAIDFARQRTCMVAIDESTTIKNPDSKRTEFIAQYIKPHADYRVILCGLPTPRSPLDLFGQFNFLDQSILSYASYIAFQARYADVHRICMLPTHVLIARLTAVAGPKFTVPGVGKVRPQDLSREHILLELDARGVYTQTVPVIKAYKHEDELHAKIMPHSYRVLLKDCYDLPPKIYMPLREVEMTDEQQRIYDELKAFATAELDNMEHVTATHVLTRMLRLHQVLCGHTKEDKTGKVHTFKENRTQEVLNILEEYDGKAIIWCSYDEDIRKVSAALVAEYGEGSVARFWGGNADTREQEEKVFLTQAACRFQVATPSAGGRGRTWSNADLLVYYSSTNNLEHRAQSEERADEVGKSTSIACVDIVCPGTVDLHIINALREKIDMAARITGDEWRQWLI